MRHEKIKLKETRLIRIVSENRKDFFGVLKGIKSFKEKDKLKGQLDD